MKNDMSIAKVVAMFMIVGCHLSEWFGVNIVAMILNVGVEQTPNSKYLEKLRGCKISP